MPKLPILSAKELIKIFGKAGYFLVRQKGSHLRLHHKNKYPITVPNHKTIGRGLLKKILRDSKMSVEEFLKMVE